MMGNCSSLSAPAVNLKASEKTEYPPPPLEKKQKQVMSTSVPLLIFGLLSCTLIKPDLQMEKQF